MRPLLKTDTGWELQHPPSLLRWMHEVDGREDVCVVVDSTPKVFYFATEEKRDQAADSGRVARMFHELVPLMDLPPIGPHTPGYCDQGERPEWCAYRVCGFQSECGGKRRFCG